MALPLAGIKILDLSRMAPGPFCTMLLAGLGAEVLRALGYFQDDIERLREIGAIA
jgi:crotonobetainyl-CoA:carnitine CoA-transferase CaiB-like acyl-CoA transferase